MNLDALYSELTLKTNAKLALIVLDGLGDIATKEHGEVTPLEAAATPNLDALTLSGVAQGRMTPVAPGITPGSGPGHLALFGYDPLEFQVGRGVIEALGLGLELRAGDVAARATRRVAAFATASHREQRVRSRTVASCAVRCSGSQAEGYPGSCRFEATPIHGQVRSAR